MIDVLIITGSTILTIGFWLAWPPLGLIFLGAVLLVAGLYARIERKI